MAPPFDLLAGMVRVHLDPVPDTNAPLLIAPESHRLGRIAEPCRAWSATHVAEAGDIWLYTTPILHASEAAREPIRRPVLPVDCARARLSARLQWLGLA